VATVASKSGGNGTAAYHPRQIWEMNLAPLVVAAREGAAHAARTASLERARVRRQPAWWQQRWVMVTAAGLAVVGAAGGVYAAMSRRRSASRGFAEPNSRASMGQMPAAGHERTNGLRSTMGSGRTKMTGMARNMVHKLRRGDGGELGPETPRTPERTSTRPDESHNDPHL
jgi:hypothetical protein